MRNQPSIRSIGNFRNSLKTARSLHQVVVPPVVVPPVVVPPVVVPPVVVPPVVDVICSAVRAVMNLIAYRVESTVFTSTTLLPFLIVTFDWPLENDPPATLIWIFAADKALR